MPSFETLLYTTEPPVATITLNRPDELNTIVPPMPDEVEAAVGLAEHDPAIKVIVLRGAGRAFCAGYNFGDGFVHWDESMNTGGTWDPGKDFAFTTARAAVAYDERARALVGGWKERGIRKLAVTAAEIVVDALERPRIAALTYVPPDAERTLKRGHHPAARLALELGVRWQLPVRKLLLRRRSLPPQRGLSRAERRRNVRGAFGARERDLPPRIGLIDDVYTTGATASAAASALRAAGARDVRVITFARTVRGGS